MGIENVEVKKQEKLKAELYKSKVRFHTTAMITDKDSSEKKSEGILFTVPLFQVGAKIFLRNVTLVTSLVNTCRSQTAITVDDGEIHNRKYTLELEEAFENLLNKLENLKKQVESGENTKYKPEDIEKVRQFLNDIKNGIGDNANTIAENIYAIRRYVRDVDLLATLDRISPNKINSNESSNWALAFAGYKDADTQGLVEDERKRNPVDVFFGDSVSTKNGSHLKTLIGTQSLNMLNNNFINKLKNKDFSEEIRRTSIEGNFGYNYYLCYFVQALLQIVLIDNEKSLTPMNHATIKSNWDNFLRDLSNPDLENMFDGYEPNEIEKPECPYKFVNFMLNKLLGKDLFQKLKINEEICKRYAEGSITISESLSNADHANQIITMGLDYTLDNPTYNNSLFIGQGGFVYAALHNACKKMNYDLKQKLQLLAFELKTKKIKLDQSKYTTSNEYKFGRMQEVKQKYVKNNETGQQDRTDEIESIEYEVPNDYDTDISVEDLMDLVLKVQTIEKELNDELETAISNFNESKSENVGNENEKTELFLNVLMKFQKAGILLNNDQIELVMQNQNIVEAIFNIVNERNCDTKYTDAYSWFINTHEEVVKSIDINFLKMDLLTADGAKGLFDRQEYKYFKDLKATAHLFLKLWEINAFGKNLILKIKSNLSIIEAMLKENKECTNQIIIKFLAEFDKAIIQKIDLTDKSLSDDQINEIVYNQHNNLTENQIKSIDFSKLNNLSTKILFENHLADISQDNVDTFSNIALEELTLSKLATLLGQNSNLDFSKHKDWLQSLYLDGLSLQFKNDNEPFVRFVAKHINIFSKNQILSLRKCVFENFKDKEGNIGNDAQSVLKQLSEIEEKGSAVEKNVLEMGGFPYGNGFGRSLIAQLLHIYNKAPKGPDELKEFLLYLIKNHEFFADRLHRILNFILNCKPEDLLIKSLPHYNEVYKNTSDALDDTGFKDCMSKITMILKTVLKENKDPNDSSKGKNINYLCLQQVPSIMKHLSKSHDLLDLLYDEQIKSIDIGYSNLIPEELYSILDQLGNKLQYKQFYDLVSCFNNTCIECGTPNKNNDIGSGFLTKIALISNFIDEKEKEFEDKYSEINSNFDRMVFTLDSNIIKMSQRIYQKYDSQSEYCNENRHNRALYAKSNNAENVNNDLKVGKDDKEILDKLGKLNDDLSNKINELDGKLDKTMNELDGIVAKIKQSDTKEVKTAVLSKKLVTVKELQGIEVKTAVLYKKLVTVKELQGIMDAINKIAELKKDVVTTEELDKIIVEIKKLYFEQELKDIKQKMKEFDQIYYGRKNEFLKLKTNFFAALGHLNTEKVSILFRNMYSNYMKKCSNDTGLNNQKLEQSLQCISSQNKTFWQINPIAMKIGDKEKKYTFNEFFMDGFIKLQSEKHQDGTESNFSEQQKKSMGIINIINKTEEEDEKDPKKIKVTKVEQYTPEYMLNNLPLILEQFHCDDNDLIRGMEKVGLSDLTLKFESGNKKALERFIDSEKLKFIEDASDDNEARRERNAEMNNENHRYFKAVKRLFYSQVDNILENADLVFETENPNGNGQKMGGKAFRTQYAPFIQFEFHRELKIFTRKEVEGKIDYLNKRDIIKNLAAMKENDERIYEHFLFFCGDWICHSNKFLSEDFSLENFENIVKKRIEFGCRGQGQNKLELNKEIYNLLTAVTLLSGSESVYRLKDMSETIIVEICFLITGKKGNFVPDDLQLIMSVTKLCGSYGRLGLILEHVIKNQDYKHVFTCLNMAYTEKWLNVFEKVKLIECISDRDKEIDLMSVISDIDKFNFYPDYGDDYNYASWGHSKRKLNFEFMKKLMNQLLQKYKFGVYPDATQKATLGKFLQKFIVDDYAFEKNQQEVSNFFKALMKNVPPEKSKEVTNEIIKICSNVRENSQRAAILKYVLDASNNSLKGLELLEVLEQHNYARGFMLYDKDGKQKGIAPIELDKDLIEELISDIIKKPSPLTKKEVQRLEWFCKNSKPKEQIFHDNQVSMFLQLIQKMPEGSMSLDMCLNLITKFFPTLSKEIEYGYEFDCKTCTVLNLSNLESNKHDIIKNLAYALPQDQLANIVRSFKQLRNAPEVLGYWGFDWDKYDYKDKDENGNDCRYRWVENVSDTMSCEDTHKYQKKVKEEQEDRKKQEEAEEKKEEAKTEGTQKMITVFNKSYKNKINKTILTEFKQMYESAKEPEQKNNNDNIRGSIENQTQNDNNSQSIDLNNAQKNINTAEIKIDKEEEKIEEVIQQDNNNNIIDFEENQNQNQSIDLNSNKNNIIKEEIKINENEEGDQNDINNNLNKENIKTEKIKTDKEKEKKIEEVIEPSEKLNDNLNENNVINDEKKNNIVYENKENHSNNNEIKENEENKINNASIGENVNSIKTDEIQKGFNNNNNEDQSHKNIQEEKEKEVESSGNKNINNDINKNEEPKIDINKNEEPKIDINKNEEPKIDINKIIIKKEIKTKENIIGVIVDKNIINTSKDKNLNRQTNSTVIINNNNIINNFGENQPQESGNPYTLSACLGILLPIVPSIIFGVKTQHKLTAGDIFLIIVGLIPVISAIVFGIMAYKYNQNNLDSKIPKNLKCPDTTNKNDIENNENNINQVEGIHPISSMVNGNQDQNQKKQDQNQNQKIENDI